MKGGRSLLDKTKNENKIKIKVCRCVFQILKTKILHEKVKNVTAEKLLSPYEETLDTNRSYFLLTECKTPEKFLNRIINSRAFISRKGYKKKTKRSAGKKILKKSIKRKKNSLTKQQIMSSPYFTPLKCKKILRSFFKKKRKRKMRKYKLNKIFDSTSQNHAKSQEKCQIRPKTAKIIAIRVQKRQQEAIKKLETFRLRNQKENKKKFDPLVTNRSNATDLKNENKRPVPKSQKTKKSKSMFNSKNAFTKNDKILKNNLKQRKSNNHTNFTVEALDLESKLITSKKRILTRTASDYQINSNKYDDILAWLKNVKQHHKETTINNNHNQNDLPNSYETRSLSSMSFKKSEMESVSSVKENDNSETDDDCCWMFEPSNEQELDERNKNDREMDKNGGNNDNDNETAIKQLPVDLNTDTDLGFWGSCEDNDSEDGGSVQNSYSADSKGLLKFHDAKSETVSTYTNLHVAAGKGQEEIVQSLLDRGANIDEMSSDGHTALHLAAAKGQLNCCKLLVKCGASLNIQDNVGMTAKALAEHYSALSTKKYLENMQKNIANFQAIDQAFADIKGVKKSSDKVPCNILEVLSDLAEDENMSTMN